MDYRNVQIEVNEVDGVESFGENDALEYSVHNEGGQVCMATSAYGRTFARTCGEVFDLHKRLIDRALDLR